jgi:hypothetical protein
MKIKINKILKYFIMSFSFINPKNQLWKEAKISKVHQRILEKISSMPSEVRKDKFNMEMLTMICCMIEHSIDNKDKKDKLKIDKKDLAIRIMASLFGTLTPQDIETISKNIEYLHDNDKIVKYSFWIVIASGCWDWFKKKVIA